MRTMDAAWIKALLDGVRAGRIEIDQALSELRDLPFRDLGFAAVDHHRALRTGVPEVILGQPKTAEQIAAIAAELVRKGDNVLITRIDRQKAAAVKEQLPDLKYAAVARTATIELTPVVSKARGNVALVT